MRLTGRFIDSEKQIHSVTEARDEDGEPTSAAVLHRKESHQLKVDLEQDFAKLSSVVFSNASSQQHETNSFRPKEIIGLLIKIQRKDNI